LLAAGLDGGNTMIFPKEKCNQVPPRRSRIAPAFDRKENWISCFFLVGEAKGLERAAPVRGLV
jgi:hypothetical protein